MAQRNGNMSVAAIDTMLIIYVYGFSRCFTLRSITRERLERHFIAYYVISFDTPPPACPDASAPRYHHYHYVHVDECFVLPCAAIDADAYFAFRFSAFFTNHYFYACFAGHAYALRRCPLPLCC